VRWRNQYSETSWGSASAGTKAANFAEGPVVLRAENLGADATDTRGQFGTDAEGTDGLLKGLEGLLRLLSDASDTLSLVPLSSQPQEVLIDRQRHSLVR
jgi:hypothetical protein